MLADNKKYTVMSADKKMSADNMDYIYISAYNKNYIDILSENMNDKVCHQTT